MAAYQYETIETGRAPVKAWVRGVPVEDAARRQLENIARLSFIHSHVAAMPDVHLGKGATVRSVIATDGAIVPAAVGVDIGCSMMALRTSLTAALLPDSLAARRRRREGWLEGRHPGLGLADRWRGIAGPKRGRRGVPPPVPGKELKRTGP